MLRGYQWKTRVLLILWLCIFPDEKPRCPLPENLNLKPSVSREACLFESRLPGTNLITHPTREAKHKVMGRSVCNAIANCG
jgi:hypothetical protein